MREETWTDLRIIISHLLKKLAAAVFPGTAERPSPPTQNQSPAIPAGTDCTPVSVPDAVAELSRPTGNSGLDHVHEMTIDCLQRGYLYAVRDPNDELRFAVTPAGKDYIKRMLDDNS
jgi:hypothetical protein